MGSRLETLLGRDIVLEAFNDRSGEVLVSAYTGDEHILISNRDPDYDSIRQELVDLPRIVFCWDMRKLIELGFPLRLSKPVVDVKLCFGGDQSLLRLARERLDPETYAEMLESDQRFSAHLRACKSARVDLTRHSLIRLVPSRFVRALAFVRAKATMALAREWHRGGGEGPYVRDTYPYALALYNVERAGIKVDMPFVEEHLTKEHSPAAGHFFRSVKNLESGGFVRTLFNVAGGKTGRIKVESGFNCMGIPHGDPRKAIISRFADGRIVAFDFNAIDYRCLVQATGDMELEGLYSNADDFHLRTTEKLFGKRNANALRRKIVKAFTYVYAYGGSVETLSGKTGLSVNKCREVMARLDPILYPVSTLRDRMHEAAMRDGYVETPGGKRVLVPKDAHPGMTIGLFAQTFSSYVFERAFLAAASLMEGWTSKIIFTVHDELVVDMHPREHTRDVDIMSAMEHALDGYVFKVNIKPGRNYAEATD